MKKGYYVLVIILIILVVGLSCYILFDNVSPNSSLDDIDKDTETNSFVSKLDDNLDWVYDAKYEKNVIADYYVYYGESYDAEDIIVPFINIESEYADKSNKEIKNIFDDAIEKYNVGAEGELVYVDECDYKKYINNNTLSIILTYGVGGTDVVRPDYYTYNIDLKTGKQISFKDIYTLAGFNSNNIDSKVEDAITDIMQKKCADDCVYEDITFDTWNEKSINNYKKSVNDNTIKYFLDSHGNLNIIVKLMIPAGYGEFDTIITVK